MRVFLAESGPAFSVAIAETGEALITSVEATRFDAVVLDRELSDINGPDLVFFMRHRCPGPPVILVSAQPSFPPTISFPSPDASWTAWSRSWNS